MIIQSIKLFLSENHVLKSLLFSVKTAEQLKFEESEKKRVFYHTKNFIIDMKVVLFKLIDKKEWPMQNLRNRYSQTELEIH